MRVEGAFFVREAFQGASGMWTIEDIQDEWLVAAIPTKIVGALFWSRFVLNDEEAKTTAWIRLEWYAPDQSIISSYDRIILSNMIEHPGQTFSAIRATIDLPVYEVGNHTLVIIGQDGSQLHGTVIYVSN